MKPFRTTAVILFLLSSLMLTGCGRESQFVNKGENTLDDFLDAWARGEPHDRFLSSGSPIEGSDPDWKAGFKLVSFMTLDSHKTEGTPPGIHCRVGLNLLDPAGNTVTREVDYQVEPGKPARIRRLPAKEDKEG